MLLSAVKQSAVHKVYEIGKKYGVDQIHGSVDSILNMSYYFAEKQKHAETF